MKRYFIQDAKCDLTGGGFSCGPVPSSVVVSVRFNDGTETKWLSVVEVDGVANYFLLDQDVHADLVDEDDATIERIQDYYVHELNGIALDSEYYGTFESMADAPKNPVIPLIRYIITLLRCDMDNVAGLINMAKGRFADELDIPMSDVEEEWKEDSDEE